MPILRKSFCLSAAIAVMGFASSANAVTFLASSSYSEGSVSAEANIALDGPSLYVTLTDLAANPTSAGQELSGIQIFFKDAPTSADLLSSAGTLIDIEAGPKTCGSKGKSQCPNTVTPVSGNPDHWGVALNGSDLYLATVGTGSAKGKPADLIIDGGGDYSNANSSISEHKPEIEGTGTFDIALPGDFDPIIESVEFEFGTGPDFTTSTITGPCGTAGCDLFALPGIPEPATWAMFLIGFGGIGLMMRKARRKSKAVTA